MIQRGEKVMLNSATRNSTFLMAPKCRNTERVTRGGSGSQLHIVCLSRPWIQLTRTNISNPKKERTGIFRNWVFHKFQMLRFQIDSSVKMDHWRLPHTLRHGGCRKGAT